MRYRVDMKFNRAPSLEVYVTAQNVDQAKIRAAKEAVAAGMGHPKKYFVRPEE